MIARWTLGEGLVDPASFTSIRLISGAFALAILVSLDARRKRRKDTEKNGPVKKRQGHPFSANALFLYAACFSFAYISLDAGTGALVLFACVQITMIGVGIAKGHRIRLVEGFGLATALLGFIYLVSPGAQSPDPAGAVLMAISGVAWGIYSMRGSSAVDAIGTTAGNFRYTVPLAIGLLAVSANNLQASTSGVLGALVCGAVTSGLGYAIWYKALPGLAPTAASVVQLTVPIIAALGGFAVLGEHIGPRLAISSVLILGGVAIVMRASGRDSPVTPAAKYERRPQ